ncbi:MFS transporter [Actinomadura rubrisoli]|uniref:MFS transporter n=1 Tax=Actinomadura rubrisoli TaxID=2530368 RepID=A0A4R5AMS1_9ACTN|nr:MFS transporter [Actinomadura rubrisoli]TDD73295.1 MFS transporter [Actinomadura rubrisoli]
MANRDQVPVARLWLAVLCGYLALGATLQELPGYVAGHFQQRPFIVGVTVSLAFAGTAAARPFAGRAGDLGRARPIAMAGAALTALAGAGHLLAPDIGTLLVARLVMGVGEAALFSGCLPWVLTEVDASRRGRVAGWFGLSMWAGLSGGPLLAVGMAWAGGSSAVWAAVVTLPVVSTVLIASTRRPAGPAASISLRGWRDLVPVGVGRPGMMLGLAAYGYGSLTALLVLFLAGIGGKSAGLAIFSLSFLITRTAGSPLIDRYGGLATARVVLLIETVGLALLAVASSQAAALLAVAVTGVGLGLIYPATTKLTLHHAGGLTPGTAVGAMTSFWDLGILAAGPAGGLIVAASGFRAAFAVGAGAAALALALTVVHWTSRGSRGDSPRHEMVSRA